ncbi:MAG: outer membrane protein assembly factor BamE [Pseudomonadota bacterium]
MRNFAIITTLTVLAGLAGCAALFAPPPQPGEPVAAVTAKLGRPGAVYQIDGDSVLEYATGPYGQYTYMARIGADGRLRSYEQVLTSEKFATLKVGRATKQDVLRTIGRPAETSYLSLSDLEVWSYRYKESGVWDSMMHVHFDRAGMVRMLMNGPDPLHEERRGQFR